MDNPGDRVVSVEETWERIAPLLPSLGITRLARLTGLDRIGIPVWNAIVPNSRSLAVNQGKGLTDTQARLSAAMEAIERAMAANPDCQTEITSANRLRADNRRFDLMEGLIAARRSLPAEDESLAFLTGTDLVTSESVMIPSEAVLLDRTQGDLRYWQSSDGLAAGNSALEARFHGLLERVERDAETLWYLMDPVRRAATRFDPADLTDATIDTVMAQVAEADLIATFFDMTSDTGIPCIMVYLAPRSLESRKALGAVEVTAGSAAHPLPETAALKALVEAIQSRMTFISGARDDIDPAIFASPLPEGTRLVLTAPTGPLPV